jgi:hypothetical protein
MTPEQCGDVLEEFTSSRRVKPKTQGLTEEDVLNMARMYGYVAVQIEICHKLHPEASPRISAAVARFRERYPRVVPTYEKDAVAQMEKQKLNENLAQLPPISREECNLVPSALGTIAP